MTIVDPKMDVQSISIETYQTSANFGRSSAVRIGLSRPATFEPIMIIYGTVPYSLYDGENEPFRNQNCI